MKMKRTILRYSLLFALIISTISSCKKDESGSKYSYFVSKELLLSYSSSYVNSLISTLGGAYPGINDFKSHISGDADVYRITYMTTINGEDIEASGLVCVPAVSGDYPVICFQNGTNTVDAYAPSNFAINTTYQMVEVVASMGYVVVVPDYPGFGASSQIAHPYLIAEPTVRSSVDMLFAVKELCKSEMTGISLKNEYYLIGYSQGGWATLELHKALETDYYDEFKLEGSVCGAGPYDIKFLFQNMINVTSYPMPVYLGYIVNAYKEYNQFTNPVSDILNEPYASRLSSLYKGVLGFDQINNQLTTSITGLITADFLSGFSSSSKYSSVRDALTNNSVAPWHTFKPLYLLHGGNDTQVNPAVTTYFYDAMIAAGTSAQICKKEIIPGFEHGDGVTPCMIKGLQFIMDLSASK
jgi:pimeloyl-ACP methyl ester carboxylesterase